MYSLVSGVEAVCRSLGRGCPSQVSSRCSRSCQLRAFHLYCLPPAPVCGTLQDIEVAIEDVVYMCIEMESWCPGRRCYDAAPGAD